MISGALMGIKSAFALSPFLVEVVTSWVTLGALLGALAGGELADRIGRKRAVLIAGALFTLGAAVQALAPPTTVLVAERIIGAGVGVAAVAAPLYAVELAPASLRGRFVSAYQLALVGLVAFIISFAFSLEPVVWIVINEIFPGRIRGRAVAVCTAVNWGSAFLVSQFFMSLIGWIGSSATFWLFAAFSVIGWVWVYV